VINSQILDKLDYFPRSHNSIFPVDHTLKLVIRIHKNIAYVQARVNNREGAFLEAMILRELPNLHWEAFDRLKDLINNLGRRSLSNHLFALWKLGDFHPGDEKIRCGVEWASNSRYGTNRVDTI
jgi:hypothetical protein